MIRPDIDRNRESAFGAGMKGGVRSSSLGTVGFRIFSGGNLLDKCWEWVWFHLYPSLHDFSLTGHGSSRFSGVLSAFGLFECAGLQICMPCHNNGFASYLLRRSNSTGQARVLHRRRHSVCTVRKDGVNMSLLILSRYVLMTKQCPNDVVIIFLCHMSYQSIN